MFILRLAVTAFAAILSWGPPAPSPTKIRYVVADRIARDVPTHSVGAIWSPNLATVAVSTPATVELVPPKTTAPSEIAVMTALDQVGKRYVFATRGPDTFDCAGLISYAWEQAGISIPTNTYAQWRELAHVPLDEIQPGDLVFYNNLGHVYMYVGDGQVISAPRTGQTVRVQGMPASGVRKEVARPG
jgi:cell wall-associated NlpC family hydrolase